MRARLALLPLLIITACSPADFPLLVPPVATGGGSTTPAPDSSGGGTGASSTGGGTGTTTPPVPPTYGWACNTTTNECSTGTTCRDVITQDGEGVCATRCDETCPANSACIGGNACVPNCTDDLDCADGVHCVKLANGSGVCAMVKSKIVSSIVIDPSGTSAQEFTTSDLQQDLLGTLHVVYRSGGAPRYGRCFSGADCTNPAAWRFVTLTGQDARLHLQMGVSRYGKVYLAWVDVGGIDNAIRVAQCDANDCAVASRWKFTTLETSVTATLETGKNLVVDDSGSVHLLARPFGATRLYVCDTNCDAASSWTYWSIPGLSCETAALAIGAGRVGIACNMQGSLKFFECAGLTTCPWASTVVRTNALRFSAVSVRYRNASARTAFLDTDGAPNLTSCEGACTTGSSWRGIVFAAPRSVTDVGGIDLQFNSQGHAFLTTAADDQIRVMRCDGSSACWAPGNAWKTLATVETKAQATQTLTTQPPSCSDGFAQLWTREDPVVAPGTTGLYVLSRTHDFWGCAGNTDTFASGRYRVHLAWAPLP